MSEISRIMAVIAVLATVGSFLIDLRQVVDEDKQSGPQQGKPEQSIQPPAGGGKTKAGPVSRTPECKRDVYKAVARRLRAQKGSKVSLAQRIEWLGTDPHYDYYYDHAADKIFCLPHSKQGPLVHPRRTGRRTRRKRQAVWWSIIVIILSGVGLAIIEIARSERRRR